MTKGPASRSRPGRQGPRELCLRASPRTKGASSEFAHLLASPALKHRLGDRIAGQSRARRGARLKRRRRRAGRHERA
eukprot:3662267-Alexandrium_andersonii.AAC.1